MANREIGAVTDYLIGYVNKQQVAYISNTVEQICAFLMKYQNEHDVLIANVLDLPEISASLGFLMHCANQTYLQEKLLPMLVSMQRGEVEPIEFVPFKLDETEYEE